MTVNEPQKVAVPFMAGIDRGALWASCGMSKTSSALLTIDSWALMGELTGPTLVCGPMRVARDTWPTEARKWTCFEHLTLRWIGGTAAQRMDCLSKRPWADVYTISYDLLPWLVEYLDTAWPFRQVIADESDYLKGLRMKKGTQRAHAIARVAHTFVRKWINLTGTPVPNGLKDLWGQTWYLDRGRRLGLTHGAFMERWFKTNPYTRRVEPLPHAQREIQDAVKDICLTLDSKDYFDLREPHVTPIVVKLPFHARRIYRQLEADLFAQLESGTQVELFNSAALTNKCLQLANGAIYTTYPAWEAVHDEKIEALKSIVSESGGAQILVSYQFKSDAARITQTLKSVARLDEPTGMSAFMSGDAQIGLAHEQSLGHGVDGLQTRTCTLVRFGHSWNMGKRLQMLERIGPMRQLQAGFNRVVMVYDLIAEDTLDEEVIARHDSKREVQDLLLEAAKRRA